MAGITLDAGALILAERRDVEMWKWVRLAREDGIKLLVPAPALAQAWRGPTSAPLANLLRASTIEPLDEFLARLAGELCSRSGTSDIVDAAVVVCAAVNHTDILTTDQRDIRRLVSHFPGAGRVHVL